MQTLSRLDDLRAAVAAIRSGGGTLALVPTMGALHAGHLALVTEAKRRASHVAVSIFVNPTQFAPTDDFDAYPRTLAADQERLIAGGADLLWAPTADVMYPAGFSSTLSLNGVTEPLEGASRPGHFDGVATVVAKLFNQVTPDVALFGEKDFQQLAVIRQMAKDMDFGLEVIGVPTERDADGLALSSRNAYLSTDQRAAAVALPDAMKAAAAAMEGGADVAATLEAAKTRLTAAGFGPIDYVTLADSVTLRTLDLLDRPARLLIAARLGTTRLIDNIAVNPA